MEIKISELFDLEKILEQGKEIHDKELLISPNGETNVYANKEAISKFAEGLLENSKMIKKYFCSQIFNIALSYARKVNDKKLYVALLKIEKYQYQIYENASIVYESAYSLYTLSRMLQEEKETTAKKTSLDVIKDTSKKNYKRYLTSYRKAMIAIAKAKEPLGEKYEQAYDILSTIASSGAIKLNKVWKYCYDSRYKDEYYVLEEKIDYDQEVTNEVFLRLKQKYNSDSSSKKFNR